MPTFLVNMGMNFDTNVPIITTVRADTFAADESFMVFKVGSVVVKAIPVWNVHDVEMVDPPVPKDESNDNSNSES